MAIYRSGTFTVADKTAVQTLNLGFVPDLLILEDITLLLTTGDGITATWDQAMNAIAGGPITKLIDVSGGTLTQSTLTTTWCSVFPDIRCSAVCSCTSSLYHYNW